MHRSLLSARSVRSLMAVLRPKNRTFATPPIKDQSPPSPIEPSKEQAHPIGAYYESILQKPQTIPVVKPEEPPASASTTTATTSTAPAQSESAPSEQPEPVPAKRGRKPKSVSRTITSSSLALKLPASDVSEQSSDEQEEKEEASSNTSPSIQDRARLVFGSCIGGPPSPMQKPTPTLSAAGVMVLPRPEEPDNCCMSGCVNCVWDAYRDEMEAWAAANTEVEARKRKVGVALAAGSDMAEVAGKEETVGNDAAWSRMGVERSPGDGKISKDFWHEELYKNVPVGIREFMKHEKRLKEKHAQEGTLGA